MRWSDLVGKVALASFIDTKCQDMSPMVTARMRSLQKRLREVGSLDEKALLLSFNTDPARDTPAALREYAERFQADERVWHFLTCPEETMVPLIVDGFRLEAQRLPPSDGGHAGRSAEQMSGYEVMHSSGTMLIDTEGRIPAYYDSEKLDIEQVLRDIRTLT